MKVEFKDVDEKKGIVRVTYADERWYFDITKKENGIPVYIGRPSITWIGNYYYKGKQFLDYIAKKGSMAAVEDDMTVKGTRGSKIHSGIELVLSGKEVLFDEKVLNPDTGQMEELTSDEFGAVKSFLDWWNEELLMQYTDIQIHHIETSLTLKESAKFSRGFGCTVDLVLGAKNIETQKTEILIIDHKSGPNIFNSAKIQLAGIKLALMGEDKEKRIEGIEDARVFTLQVGFKKNKFKKYKLTEHKFRTDLLNIAYATWEEENPNASPETAEYPTKLELSMVGVKLADGTIVEPKKVATKKVTEGPKDV